VPHKTCRRGKEMKLRVTHKFNIIAVGVRIMILTKNLTIYHDKSSSILQYVQYVNNNRKCYHGGWKCLTIWKVSRMQTSERASMLCCTYESYLALCSLIDYYEYVYKFAC